MTRSGLAILAGGGQLPATLADAARHKYEQVIVLAIEGAADDADLSKFDPVRVRIERVGDILEHMRRCKVADVVLAGHLQRPDLARLKPDWQGMKLLPRVLKAARAGDDSLLSVIIAFFQEQGFRVIGADDVLQSLLTPTGTLGRVTPSAIDEQDIAHGIKVVRRLGELDIGQAAVVREGYVLGVEAAEGTDALIARCGGFRRDAPSGVLVKLAKPNQDRRIDLPTVGPVTVEQVAAASLRGIALEAGGTLLLERARVIETADRLGIFVAGIGADSPGTE